MAGLKADIPDALDSGGPRSIGLSMLTDQVVPLVFGVAVAAFAVLTGLGLFNSLRPVLGNVPVVGTLLAGGSGDDRPSAWRGL